VAWAHEELRFGKPAHGAVEVSAVDRKDSEVLRICSPHISRRLLCFAIPRLGERVAVSDERGLAFLEIVYASKINPCKIASLTANWPEQVADNGNGEDEGSGTIEEQTHLHHEAAPGHALLLEQLLLCSGRG